ncbi:MAG: phosphonoacetaldehyde reductase [Clostridia bacterium]|nr:phosphonoacetaldehyde reductase [Clostridia bacterium]
MEQLTLFDLNDLRPLLTGKRFLLVHGPFYASLGLSPFFDSLDAVHFTDFTPNPLYEQVEAGVRSFLAQDCQAIVAVGGGSAMDVAKCVKLFCHMDPSVNYLTQEKADTGVPLYAIPTTAGTGSEATRHAVIYYQGEKQSVSHPSIVPDAAVLLPEVLTGLPLYQKKCTLLDALCQAVESWWSRSATAESAAHSRQAIAGIRAHWQAYIEQGDPDAARQILLAANQAGKAINITATTAPHAMSYKLTSLYHLPHGHAVALCMAQVWPYTREHAGDDLRLQGVLAELEALGGYGWFVDLMGRLGMASPSAREREAELRLLASSVNPIRLQNHPIPLSAETLRAFYEKIVQ